MNTTGGFLMLYPKNQTPTLDMELFRNPTAEYRGTPFWAWNCKLDKEELKWQLDVFRQMGFGGGHFHVRTGMATPYLSDEYMDIVKTCVEKCKQNDMLAWLYDEDRWPSGAAGGLVTKDKQYRARYLLFTPTPYSGVIDLTEKDHSQAVASRAENGRFLCAYDVELDPEGYLVSYRAIGADAEAAGEKWYAYLETTPESPWYNNQTYVDTLNKKAMDRFIEITYEAYNRTISDEFDKTVPAIFTDEPQFTHKSTLRFATDKTDVALPWTDDLADTFDATYPGEHLLESVPELIWERADKVPSVLRYHYHDHICQRFTEAFADNCGAWCREHGLALTGHMMEEPTLKSQTAALGEAMRAYRGFDLPGIDMLCARTEYTTAKQAQSAVHQFGYEGMLSELYGVTNWDFDFRGHKLHGDWQAALGVTIRVPHLAWVSMGGEAKRDYPAAIGYQSPWWEKYSWVEDHFSRVNTAMSRGKPVVKVGVIHPVESYWLHWGPSEQTALVRDDLDQNFQNITQWLLFGGIDFDFISESLLPDQCAAGGAPLQVGQMAYDVILVPGCETLRSSTLDRLEAFADAGGKLVFAGAVPTLESAVASSRSAALAQHCLRVSMTRSAILNAVESARIVDLRNETGALTENLLYQLRQDGDGRWFFLAHGKEPYNKDISRFQDLRIRVQGEWIPTVYNTLTGETETITYTTRSGYTEISRRMYDYDSLLLWLEPAATSDSCTVPVKAADCVKSHVLPTTVPYTLSEPNVLLLDQAEFALDDGPWQPKEEILRLDNTLREKMGWPGRQKSVAQPWTIPEEPVTHTARLRWHIRSTISCSGIQLAIEDAPQVQLTFNGKAVPSAVTGWYTDKSIQTIALPPLQEGDNVLEAVIPFGKRTNLEWAYLLGDFGVEAVGCHVQIVPTPAELAFGDFTKQGFPFYGGNITYHIPVCCDGGELTIRASQYRGSLQTVSLDSGLENPMIYPPYTVSLGTPAAGPHTVNLTLYGHRRNAFGPIHLTDRQERWIGPNAWRSEEERWSYDYQIAEEGPLSTPVITETR